MDTNTILTAVYFVTIIGVICAAVLCIASKFMHVKVDERLAQLTEIMPGANCGACGFPGCSGYAKAIISGDAKPNQCSPGGSDLIAKISGILGISDVDTGSIVKKAAVVHCMGDNNAQQLKMEYKGFPSCSGAKQLFGGQQACAFGCLGYGDCQKACPTNAICIENGLAHIITNLCTGCGLCVKTCPNKILTIENADMPVVVACKNIEKGAVTRKKCSFGCIACTKCVKECPEGAIVIEENLARIDYTKCSGCGKCVEVCMTKCIRKLI